MIEGARDIEDVGLQLKAAQEQARYESMSETQLAREIKRLEKQMLDYARNLEFEKAAEARDRLARSGGISSARLRKRGAGERFGLGALRAEEKAARSAASDYHPGPRQPGTVRKAEFDREGRQGSSETVPRGPVALIRPRRVAADARFEAPEGDVSGAAGRNAGDPRRPVEVHLCACSQDCGVLSRSSARCAPRSPCTRSRSPRRSAHPAADLLPIRRQGRTRCQIGHQPWQHLPRLRRKRRALDRGEDLGCTRRAGGIASRASRRYPPLAARA